MTVMTVPRPRPLDGRGADLRRERVLDRLRYDTRAHAERLHRHARLHRLATRADYTDMLALLLGFYRPLDRWIAATLAPARLELSLARRAKAPPIARDLAALDASPAMVRFHPLPLRSGSSYALGWLYGIEVAALCGRIMGRRLNERLGIGPDGGGAFFDGYGADTHAMWQRLADVLARRIDRDGELAAAEDGAVDFFEALADWLSLPGPVS
jgi:heme oxygenase